MRLPFKLPPDLNIRTGLIRAGLVLSAAYWILVGGVIWSAYRDEVRAENIPGRVVDPYDQMVGYDARPSWQLLTDDIEDAIIAYGFLAALFGGGAWAVRGFVGRKPS